MVLPYYRNFLNGEAEERHPASFRLHDSTAEFESSPRVFTSFIAERGEDGRFEVPGGTEHVRRLLRDGAAFTLISANHPEHRSEWIQAELEQFFSGCKADAVRVRLVLSREGLEFFADEPPPRENSTVTLVSFRGSRSRPGHKTTATEVCRASLEYARSKNADEALLIGDDGLVGEGTWSNFFWFDSSGALFTREDGVLPGVIRSGILELTAVYFSAVTLDELLRDAHEAFITQSSRIITPVDRIDGRLLPGGAPGPMTARILELWKKSRR